MAQSSLLIWVLRIFHIPHIYCLNITLYWEICFLGSKHSQVFYTLSEFSNCNKTRLGSTKQTSHDIIHKAHFILEDFQLAHLTRPLFKEQVDTRWIPPSHPWYKVNTDAVVFSNLKIVGISVVIHDHEGSVIATLSKHLPLPLGPLEAKAKAVDEAVSFAWDIRIREVIFETDSKVVSDTLYGTITLQVSIVDIIGGTLH